MSALETLLEKCTTDAARVTMLRSALELSETEARTAARLAQVVHLAVSSRMGVARCGFSGVPHHTVDENAVDAYPDHHHCAKCVAIVLAERAAMTDACGEWMAATHRHLAKRELAEKAIAKARKALRTPPMSVGVTKAHAALDWRLR